MKPVDKNSDLQPPLAVMAPEPNSVGQPQPNVAEMLQSVIRGGVTTENAAALEKLVGLYERMQDRDAEKAFNTAFVNLQAEMPVIVAKSIIPNRGKYQKFEDIMDEIAPLLKKHGFSVSFTMDTKENRILETCHLRHVSGHSQSNSFAVRTRKADSDTQADCMAATTAKRNALCNALNIVIRQDCLNEENDAGIEGDPNSKISSAQADELERRVKMSDSNVAAFLKFAGAEKFSEIPAFKYDMLDAMLKRKEQQGR